ncbi:MAG: hypothetical protein JXR63_11930 [Spirochaetales bacterium]|nr:hypothetical protein [Spirochaetales bacterium]
MKKIITLILVLTMAFPALFAEDSIELTVGTHNFLFVNSKGDDEAFSAISEIVKKTDIIGCQEMSWGKVRKLAKLTGYNYVKQFGWSPKILTKHKVVAVGFMRQGAKIELPNGKQVWIFNVHLPPAPYGPYEVNQISGIFGGKVFDSSSPDDVESLVERNRAKRIDCLEGRRLLKAIELASKDNIPMFITGDFNEPSHLDWTQAAVDAGNFPVVVKWPASVRMAELGFKDSFRVLNPDPVAVPGFTWSPFEKYQTNVNVKGETIPEPFDRIDFVYYKGDKVTPLETMILGPEGDSGSDIHIPDYSSDHRSVLTKFLLK